ncbi:MAG: lytic transglycosylase domain-containing protein [Desulfobaccales bacterium]
MMLKTLFFSMLLHLGWMDKQAPWVQQVNPRDLTQTARRTAQAQPGFPGALWKQAAERHGVDPVMLYSVALFESGKRGGRNKTGPWPFALHFNEAGVSIYASSIKEARFVLAHITTDNVDIGLGQVNYKSHKNKVQRAEDLLDPKINLTVASQILAEAITSTPDLELGVGRYHSWKEWRARAYGRKVLTIYKTLKEYLDKQETALARRQPSHG